MTIFFHSYCRPHHRTRPITSGIHILFWGFFILSAQYAQASEFNALKGNGVNVLFSPSLKAIAEETAQMAPKIKIELQEIFKWPFDWNPTVILMNDHQRFLKMTHSPLVVGFAVPKEDIVVIDASRIGNPVNFANILKHELCHLLLHETINKVPIPRWFDEGVAQWVANGVMDIVHEQKEALLPKAAFSDRLIPLGRLANDFPRNENELRLAYEESKSVIDTIISTHGKARLLEIMALMKEGIPLREAVFRALDTPLYKIEEEWRASLKQNIAWFAHLSYYLYEILFALGALILVYGFIKGVKRKRSYMEEEDPSEKFG